MRSNIAAVRALKTAPSRRENIASKLRVVADPTRMAILEQLGSDECCVCDLADALGVTQPLLSHHLRQLRDAGLILDRKSGRWTYYRIERPALDELLSSVHEIIGRGIGPHRRCED